MQGPTPDGRAGEARTGGQVSSALGTSRQGSQRHRPLSWGARVRGNTLGGTTLANTPVRLGQPPRVERATRRYLRCLCQVPELHLRAGNEKLASLSCLFFFFFLRGVGGGGWGGGLVATAVRLSGCRLSQTTKPPRPAAAAARPGSAAPAVRAASAQVARGKRQRRQERGSESAWAGADRANGEAPGTAAMIPAAREGFQRGEPLPLLFAVGRTSGRTLGRGGRAAAPSARAGRASPRKDSQSAVRARGLLRSALRGHLDWG